MKPMPVLLLSTLLIFATGAVAQKTSSGAAVNAAPETVTIASTEDRGVSRAEKQIVDLAEAMPEDKFNFSPESVIIAGSNYKGVRSFAVQVRHMAASNYALWSPLVGAKVPADYLGGDGPQNLKTKAEIIQFLKESYALGHKAAASLTTENMLQPVAGGKSPRLFLVEFGVAHAYDHYGQMVEYLRMNGIIPPTSRKSN